MKVAVATIDGVGLSQHFGQSKGFVIFDVEGKEIRNREFRINNHTPHAQGVCGHHHEHKHGEHHHHGGNHHREILQLLEDCCFVICGGMGAGAVSTLQAAGVKPVVMTGHYSVEEAVTAYLEGTAKVREGGGCGHHASV